MEGVNGGHLLSVGANYLHSYTIGSNGVLGPQASEFDTQSYGGAECGSTSSGGTPNGAILDHTGQDFYVQLYGAPGSGGVSVVCAAWQAYRIGANGSFTFLGDIEYEGSEGHDASPSSIPTVSSNDTLGTASSRSLPDSAPPPSPPSRARPAASGRSTTTSPNRIQSRIKRCWRSLGLFPGAGAG